MTNEEFYQRTIKDLQSKIESEDEYQLLRASALIRQLLVDGDVSLALVVKKPYNLKLSFRYNNTKAGYSAAIIATNPLSWSLQDGLDPETLITRGEIIDGTLDDFLSNIILIHNSEYLSVKDVITYAANVMGGVHAGKAKNTNHEIMETISIKFGNIAAAANQIKSIGRVILRALEPLNQVIADKAKV
ncbi:hypothetical protein [Croceitalea rosinachiae]|uniref:AbiTii domain-containing protein n=1 Tax=Croceitalea rosinachiae TaxID=3075596 RepID=A0ABU3ACY8_9FLAO|nr:hypothetical protein [Croceitalea sp. F388]MDT0608049.1 hypothetical protein [Croceitalea sp. F388]